MIGKISTKSQTVLEPKHVQKKIENARYGSLAKAATTTLGLLAVSQGFAGVAARPATGATGLAEPSMSGGMSGLRKLASTDRLPGAAVTKDSVAPAPALLHDITTLSEAPAPSPSAAASAAASRPMQTWIVNKSSVDLLATTTYNCFVDCSSNSTFIDHLIPKRTEDVDQYCQQHQFFNFTSETGASESNPLGLHCPPSVTLNLRWSKQNATGGQFTLEPDHSVIVANMEFGQGLNVYQSLYGDLSTPNGKPLGQIYGNVTAAA